MERDPVLPYFLDQLDPVAADKRGLVIPRSSLRRLRLVLDNARNEVELKTEGDMLFADGDSTGVISVRLNSEGEDPWPIRALGGVQNLPIKSILVTHAAQAGKVLNLWYGYRARFIAPSSEIATIGSITSPVSLNPEDARYFLFGDDETADGEAFMGITSNGPVAANVAFSQLHNPAGTGVLIYADSLEVSPLTAADRIQLYMHNAAIGAAVATVGNKNGGGAVPQAELRGGVNAAPVGTLVGDNAAPLNTTYAYPLKAPFRLPEGRSVIARAFTTNTLDTFTWHWREKPT